MLRKKLLTFIFLISFLPIQAQITLVKNSKPVARILLCDTTKSSRDAALMLNTFIQRMSGVQLPVANGVKAKRNDVLIGGRSANAGEDGFTINCQSNRLTIESGGDKGAVLGVVHLLERFLGCDYYAKNAYDAPARTTIALPKIVQWTETPAFRYRQTDTYGSEDPFYNLWFGFETPNQMFVGNLWVHTFNQILPASKYGKNHPEWYSEIKGKRQPGDHSQWCLSNDEVFEMACQKIDSIFRANPSMKMISVSQNDGNDTYCQCEKCRAIYEEEGAVSGAYVRFMNRLAQRFPDKEISTLAYLFTMLPPKHVKPLPNVNIMLCDIDCKREVPLTDNESGRVFVRALEGWSKISNNIFVWDYGINFDNYVSPFPNFHVLQPNIQLFHRNHVNMLFEQMGGGLGTDFSELRAYMVGKLMWNPNLNSDSLMRHFMNGYYGAAGQPIYQYRQEIQRALLDSGKELWIYDSPISHKEGMLDAKHLARYSELFDEAEAAVAGDSARLARVRISRLPLQYSELEIARTEKVKNTDEMGENCSCEVNPEKEDDMPRFAIQRTREDILADKVQLFRERCTEYAIPTLTERNNKPLDYCDLYLKRYIPHTDNDVAYGAKVTFAIPPAARYQKIAETALTDGLFGGTTYVEGWVGWEGSDAEMTVDLGKVCNISHVETDFLHQLGAWILLPKSVTYSVSTDGQKFVPFGKTCKFAEDRDLSVKFIAGAADVATPMPVRYIRVNVEGIINCPAWHYGVGYPAWFFCDEISAY